MEKPTPQEEKKSKLSFREFFQLGEVGTYFFRKKNIDRPNNINIRMMHGVNKISIIIFLLAILYFVLRRVF